MPPLLCFSVDQNGAESDESASVLSGSSSSSDDTVVPLFCVGSSENLSDKTEPHDVHQWLTKSTRAASFTAATATDEAPEVRC